MRNLIAHAATKELITVGSLTLAEGLTETGTAKKLKR